MEAESLVTCRAAEAAVKNELAGSLRRIIHIPWSSSLDEVVYDRSLWVVVDMLVGTGRRIEAPCV